MDFLDGHRRGCALNPCGITPSRSVSPRVSNVAGSISVGVAASISPKRRPCHDRTLVFAVFLTVCRQAEAAVVGSALVTVMLESPRDLLISNACALVAELAGKPFPNWGGTV